MFLLAEMREFTYLWGKLSKSKENMKRLLSIFLLTCSLCIIQAQEYVQKTNLPTIYINTEGGQNITSKEEYINSTLYYVDGNGIKQYDNVQIRGRGNSTWQMAKKPFRIKFASKEKFLGNDRANAKSWTLLANYADKTLIRNAVAACIGKFAGQPFTAAAQFVDLVLNGTYLGNYQVSDQMEVRKKRVDITEQDEVMTEGSNITGGYFLEVDGFATGEPVWYKTNRGVMVTIKSPDDEIIATAQKNYIRNHMQLFEDALFADNFTDPAEGYRQYVDSLTLASWYISTELTGNVDGFWSTYMYKEKDDQKFYWGPLWDYDIAFNNCDRVGDVSKELMVNKGFGEDLTRIWMIRMWQDPWFIKLINRTWKEYIDQGFEEHVMNFIDSISNVIDESQQLNFKKWPINQHVYNEIVLFNTYREGVDYLKSFLHSHFEYLTDVFEMAESGEGDAPIPSPVFAYNPNYYYRITNKGNGKSVDVNENGVCIWEYDSERPSQQWELVSVDGYYQLINRDSNKALYDNAEEERNGYKIGTQLAICDTDATDFRQLWSIVPINTGNTYTIVNRQTNLAWNNNAGSANNGNAVISWTNDGNNAQKTTRQWKLVKDAPKVTDGLKAIQHDTQYIVYYSPQTQQLRFAAENPDALKGTATVYTTSSAAMLQFSLQETADISALAPGIYILSWTEGGKNRAVKFMKQ